MSKFSEDIRDLVLSVVDELPNPIFIKDDQLRFVYLNKAAADQMGSSVDALLGKTDHDVFTPAVADTFTTLEREILVSGLPATLEEVSAPINGHVRDVLSRKTRHVRDNGQVFLTGTNSDHTKFKRRETQHRALAETIPVGIMQIDGTGHIRFCNQLALDAVGLDGVPRSASVLGELLNLPIEDFPGLKFKREVDVHINNGPLRRVLVVCSGWIESNATKKTAFVSFIDLSEMAELRRINDDIVRLNSELAENMQRLKQAQDELVKRGRMEQLGQLTATVAHELRNPLGAVRTSSFLLERKLKDKGFGVETQLQRISNGIQRCDNIITQLLDFSRVKKLTPLSSDLDQWVVDLIEDEAKRLSSAIQIECQLNLESQMVPFDPSRLQRAIINLIANSSEAMVGAGDDASKFNTANPKITISTFERDGMIAIEVRDNGPGIAPEIIEKVREPLFTTKSFGTGLGIPAIEQIAVQHDGKLDIQSVLGEGACFTIWLPMNQSVDVAA